MIFCRAPRRDAMHCVFTVMLILWGCTACQGANPQPCQFSPSPTPSEYPTPRAYSYQIDQIYPHDPDAFTQGFLVQDGVWYEGTGLLGHSELRRFDLENGNILAKTPLSAEYFGEGIAYFDGSLYQITWQNHAGFIYDAKTLTQTGTFSYETEGWGLTTAGNCLLMSDGSDQIYYMDPKTQTVVGQIAVRDENGAVTRLNELEWIQGEVWANIWQTNQIIQIDPTNGAVVGQIDLTGLLSEPSMTGPMDVLNGIAYNSQTDSVYVTGKLWPSIFKITLTP